MLLFERMLNEKFPSDQKYSYEQRGANMMKVYAYDYSEQYHKMLDGMVERRMKEAIISVGSFWYTAWVNAGMPNLKGIEKVTISEEEKKKWSVKIKCGVPEKFWIQVVILMSDCFLLSKRLS